MATSPNSRQAASPAATRAKSPTSGPPTKKALLIGIKYSDQTGDLILDAPYKDTDRVQQMLIRRFGYNASSITMMRDDHRRRDTPLWPNKANMQAQMRALVRDVKPGDHRFFMFSGHGIQPEGQAFQAVQPVDGFDDTGKIVVGKLFFSNNLFQDLISPIPANDCTFTALVDCCWSRDILELDVSSLHSSQQRALTRRSTLDFGLRGSSGRPIARRTSTMSLDNESTAAENESLLPGAWPDQTDELSSSAKTVTGPIATMNIGSLRSSPVATMNRGSKPRPQLELHKIPEPLHSSWTFVPLANSASQEHQPPGTPQTILSASSDEYMRQTTPDASSILSSSQGIGLGPFELPIEAKLDNAGATVVESLATSQDGHSTMGGSIGDDHEHDTFGNTADHDFEEIQADEMLVDTYSNTSNRGDSPVQIRGGIKHSNVPSPTTGVVGRDYAMNTPMPTSVITCWSNKTDVAFEYDSSGLLTDAIVRELDKQPIPSYLELFRGVRTRIAQRCEEMNKLFPVKTPRKQDAQLTRMYRMDYDAQVHP